MLYSQFVIKDCMTRLVNVEKLFKENADLEILKQRFYGICFDLCMAAEENLFTLGNDFYLDLKERADAAVDIVDNTDCIETIKETINNIIRTMPDTYDYTLQKINNFLPAVYDGITKYKPLSTQNLQAIGNAALYNRPLTLFDPRCRDGANLGAIKTSIPNSTAYGLEADSGQADRAKAVIDRVAKGGLLGSRISNDVFDIMFMEAPVSWDFTTMSGTMFKAEKNLLHSTIKFLRPDGMLVFVLPYFRMHKDMCLMIAKNFTNVQVRKFASRDFFDRGLVAIIGQKTEFSREPDEETYKMLRRLYNINEVPDMVISPFEGIRLPQDRLNVELFRGSILDMEEMQAIVNTSGCMKVFWDDQEVEKLSENQKNPLLPFNIGQIGLVLTSGCLDGVVEEGNGHYHVIKGRVSKKSSTEEGSGENNTVEVSETISNRVEINVIMPNGDYKVLA